MKSQETIEPGHCFKPIILLLFYIGLTHIHDPRKVYSRRKFPIINTGSPVIIDAIKKEETHAIFQAMKGMMPYFRYLEALPQSQPFWFLRDRKRSSGAYVV